MGKRESQQSQTSRDEVNFISWCHKEAKVIKTKISRDNQNFSNLSTRNNTSQLQLQRRRWDFKTSCHYRMKLSQPKVL